jgi:D-serine deaminase-like pyridoxal phosphate-dependent protein
MSIFSIIQKPTLLYHEERAARNIHRMAEKAKAQGVRFRPHFKTHQSAAVGELFRREGVTSITVSSVDMAQYFANHGWEDITLAFPANLRQLEGIARLARSVRLGLLVESPESVQALAAGLKAPVDVWVKIDTGAGRTGIGWQESEQLLALTALLKTIPHLRFQGLLTHAGHTYNGASPQEICDLYAQSVARMNDLRAAVLEQGWSKVEVSVGDTPGCTLSEQLGRVDEIRPGNFVFYDADMFTLGVCKAEDIAVALVCPIVALHPERSEVIIYGGAIHLSKDTLARTTPASYGLVALPEADGWGEPLPGAYVRGLSQEHGMLHVRPQDLSKFKVGELVCILPAHSCLTAQAMHRYWTLDGEEVEMMPW